MSLLRSWAILALSVLASISCHAQPYPSRPLRIIVPYPPGAATDFTARLVGQRISETLGQPVVVENRGGAGGIIAAELAARAAPDGHTMLFGTPAALCISPALQSKVPYDTLRDFAPISRLVVNSMALVAHSSFPGNSVSDLVQAARAQPGKLSYASVGVGSPQHLGTELLKVSANLDIVHVPYKGGALAITDLLANRVQIYMGSMPALLQLVKGGKIKVLGIAGAERSALLPNAPTIAETIPGYEYVGTWYGLLTQARVPPEIVTRLNAAIQAALQLPDVRQQLITQGSEPAPMSVDAFTQFVRKDCPSWARAVKAAGLKTD